MVKHHPIPRAYGGEAGQGVNMALQTQSPSAWPRRPALQHQPVALLTECCQMARFFLEEARDADFYVSLLLPFSELQMPKMALVLAVTPYPISLWMGSIREGQPGRLIFHLLPFKVT